MENHSRTRAAKTSAPTAGLRFHQVLDDHMEPTIRARDYVLLAPVSQWVGEGYYLILNHFGDPQSYICSVVGTTHDPKILLHCHNKHYREETITLADFEEHVFGKVAMICNVVQPSLLQAMGG